MDSLSSKEIQRIIDMHPFAFIGGAVGDFPGLALIKLAAGGKVPIERFETAIAKSQAMGLDGRGPDIADWLNKGNNAGFVLYRAGVWVLDVDTRDDLPGKLAAEIERLAPPQVRTPSGGCHYYFRLPDDLLDHPELKAHLNLRKVPGAYLQADLKLGGRRTMVVAPGSRKMEGCEYTVVNPWSMPPVLDPRSLFPEAPLFHPKVEPQVRVEFLTDGRPLKHRLARARRYLKKAPVSVSGRGGRAQLFKICVHLCAFLRIPPKLGLALLTRPLGASWNDRCVDGATGVAYPWSKVELMKALEAGQHAVPDFGVILHKLHEENEAREAKITKACKVIRRHTKGGTVPVPIRSIYEVAVDAMDMEASHCTLTRFGRVLSSLKVHRTRKGQSKVWSLNLRHGLGKLQLDLQRAFRTDGDPSEPHGLVANPHAPSGEDGPS